MKVTRKVASEYHQRVDTSVWKLDAFMSLKILLGNAGKYQIRNINLAIFSKVVRSKFHWTEEA